MQYFALFSSSNPWRFESAEERDRRVLQWVAEDQTAKGRDRIYRLESHNRVRLTLLNGEVQIEDGYVPPVPHAALSYELLVMIPGGGPSGSWAFVQCSSHDERMLLARYLLSKGQVGIDGNIWPISSIELNDRTIVVDNRFAIRRSRVGSLDSYDRHVTRQLQPLINLVATV